MAELNLNQGPSPDYIITAVRMQLKEIDGLLDIGWFPNVSYDERSETFEGRYALVCMWAQSDDRWQMYHSGEIGEPFDILGYFTQASGQGQWADPHAPPVEPDLLMDQVMEHLGRMDQTRETWKERMKKAAAANVKLQKDRHQGIVDEVVDELVYSRKRIKGEPIVNLGAALDPKEGENDGA